jgi:acetyl esterase/lipase
VLLIDYRLLPENPVQAPLEDFLAAYRGLLEREEVFPGSIVFGGDSNGAGVVLAALVSLRDAGEQQPACVFSLSGAFDATLSGESMQTRENLDPLLSLEVLEDWQRQLGAANLSASLLSPLFSDLSNLAPVLLEVGDHEMWLSDSLRVAEKIRLTGGEAELHVWDEMWHVWPMYTGFPESDAAIDEVSRFIARHVGECAY